MMASTIVATSTSGPDGISTGEGRTIDVITTEVTKTTKPLKQFTTYNWKIDGITQEATKTTSTDEETTIAHQWIAADATH